MAVLTLWRWVCYLAKSYGVVRCTIVHSNVERFAENKV